MKYAMIPISEERDDRERVPDPPQNIGPDSEVFERAKGEQ